MSRPTSARDATAGGRDRLGGTAGNRLLTSATALVLAALLAAEGVTILWLGDLRTEHMFIGLVLIGPVALKLASTGYRFARYYTRAPRYRAEGPPLLPLRAARPRPRRHDAARSSPPASLLLVVGHRSDLALELHKVAFIVWSACFGVHFLWHLPRAWSTLATSLRARGPSARPARACAGCSSARPSAAASRSRSRCSRPSRRGTAGTAASRLSVLCAC